MNNSTDTSNLTTSGNTMETLISNLTPYETALNEGLNDLQTRSIRGSVSSSLIRAKVCTPKQAIVTAIAYVDSIHKLMYPNSTWVESITAIIDDSLVTVFGEKAERVESFDVVDSLESLGFIERVNDLYIIGKRVVVLVDRDTKSYSPTLASDGIDDNNRVFNYGVKSEHISPLTKKAIHILEGTESTKSVIMEDIASRVFKELEGDKTSEAYIKLSSQEYVLNGVSKLTADIRYVTEFKADLRFRLYQAACYGFNGQSSDLARSLQDIAGVSLDYNTEDTLHILLEEIADMSSLSTKDLETAIVAANKNPVGFIARALLKGDESPIKKPWNFTKFSMLIVKLRNGEKPYIGVAVGYDAKCSGPQLGALLTDQQEMLVATGFVTGGEVDDAYHRAITKCKQAGVVSLNRSDIKKPFMAIFYGAGVEAMLDRKVIESGAFDKLYNSEWFIDGKLQLEYTKAAEEIAKTFHRAITRSFGNKLSNLRNKIKGLGGSRDKSGFTSYLDNIIEHTMPDGAIVSMNYRNEININGESVTDGAVPKSVKVSVGNTEEEFKYIKFKTSEYDLQSYSRKGFVNMIQATDALIARLIIVHAHKLGIKNIVSIHDCFRVDIHSTTLLQQAIRNAYLELFGSDENKPTEHLTHSLDIVREYFIGANKATKEEYKQEFTGGLFHRGNNKRVCNSVRGSTITELIHNLGTKEEDAYFFAK